jgi:prepilin-type N-terminal cleavage/methylation domain-containing protein
MDSLRHIRDSRGHTLVELVVVIALVGMCFAVGLISLSAGVGAQKARGAAQSVQAAAAWAQTDVLWHAGSVRVGYDEGDVELTHEIGLHGTGIRCAAPVVGVSTNVARWRDGDGVGVTFSGTLASPDGGGSLYFGASGTRYRVVVRPVSGLTARSVSAVMP